MCRTGKPKDSWGNSEAGVLESTVRMSTSSPALARYRSISLKRLAYPDTWVKGVGSTIKQILRGGFRRRGGALSERPAERAELEEEEEDVLEEWRLVWEEETSSLLSLLLLLVEICWNCVLPNLLTFEALRRDAGVKASAVAVTVAPNRAREANLKLAMILMLFSCLKERLTRAMKKPKRKRICNDVMAGEEVADSFIYIFRVFGLNSR